MADEFIKGFGTLTAGLLGWMMLASWFKTKSFEGKQFTVPPSEVISDPTTNELLGIALMEALFWFAILGTLTFWVLIPAGREFRSYLRGGTSE